MPTDLEPVDKAIMKFKNHPSALLMKISFSFEEINPNDANKEIRSLSPKEAGTDNDFFPKILKNCKDSCLPFLRDLFNNIVHILN